MTHWRQETTTKLIKTDCTRELLSDHHLNRLKKYRSEYPTPPYFIEFKLNTRPLQRGESNKLRTNNQLIKGMKKRLKLLYRGRRPLIIPLPKCKDIKGYVRHIIDQHIGHRKAPYKQQYARAVDQLIQDGNLKQSLRAREIRNLLRETKELHIIEILNYYNYSPIESDLTPSKQKNHVDIRCLVIPFGELDFEAIQTAWHRATKEGISTVTAYKRVNYNVYCDRAKSHHDRCLKNLNEEWEPRIQLDPNFDYGSSLPPVENRCAATKDQSNRVNGVQAKIDYEDGILPEERFLKCLHEHDRQHYQLLRKTQYMRKTFSKMERNVRKYWEAEGKRLKAVANVSDQRVEKGEE